jgi:hypothetical protein
MTFKKILYCFLFLSVLSVYSQKKDSLKSVVVLDSATIAKNKKKMSKPAKAALFSAILPGAGQFYNKSYWKIPIVYAAIGGSAYLTYYFGREFKKADYVYTLKTKPELLKHTHAYDRIKNDTAQAHADYGRYSNSSVQDIATLYRDRRDRFAMITVLMYFANIVEAHVDAHLKTFNISEDVALNIRPSIMPTMTGVNTSLELNFYFKNNKNKHENSTSRLW